MEQGYPQTATQLQKPNGRFKGINMRDVKKLNMPELADLFLVGYCYCYVGELTEYEKNLCDTSSALQSILRETCTVEVKY